MPTDRETLLALADRAEKATGPDRELDAEIAIALDLRASDGVPVRKVMEGSPHNLPRDLRLYWPGLPDYTASIDAALTLVPEGWHVEQLSEGPNIEPRPRGFAYDGTWFAHLHAMIPGLFENLKYGKGATPALALVAAACRALAAKGDEA